MATTKKSTAASRTAKKPAAKRTVKRTTASKSCCKKSNAPQMYTFVALSLCFMITAMISAVILIGTKLNNDALAKNLEDDRNRQGVTIIYAEPEDDTPELVTE